MYKHSKQYTKMYKNKEIKLNKNLFAHDLQLLNTICRQLDTLLVDCTQHTSEQQPHSNMLPKIATRNIKIHSYPKNDNFNYNLIFNATVPSSSSSSYLSLILMPLFQNTFIFLSYYNLFEVQPVMDKINGYKLSLCRYNNGRTREY